MAYIKETYITEWIKAYEQVIAQSMESLSTGKDTPMEKLFSMIDETSRDTSQIDRLSLKKDAYMALIQAVTVASQKTAMELVDKKFTAHFEYEMAETKVRAENNKADNAAEAVNATKAQVKLTNRQVEGYDDDKNQKMLQTAINGHAMVFEALEGSDADAGLPTFYTNKSAMDTLFYDAVGIAIPAKG